MKIIFDIGATTTRIASISEEGSLGIIERYPTPKIYSDGLEQIIQKVRLITKETKLESVVGGITGSFNEDNSSFRHYGAIKDWSDKPFKKDLESSFNCPVFIHNDAELGGIGESVYGAGKEFQSFIYMTIGTGVGGAWIQNQKASTLISNFEPGKQIVNFELGTTFEEISGKNIIAKTGHQASDLETKILWKIVEPILTVGLYNSFLHWPSEAIILGGGVINPTNLPLEKLEQNLKEKLKMYQNAPRILKSKLGDNSNLFGAIVLSTTSAPVFQ